MAICECSYSTYPLMKELVSHAYGCFTSKHMEFTTEPVQISGRQLKNQRLHYRTYTHPSYFYFQFRLKEIPAKLTFLFSNLILSLKSVLLSFDDRGRKSSTSLLTIAEENQVPVFWWSQKKIKYQAFDDHRRKSSTSIGDLIIT